MIVDGHVHVTDSDHGNVATLLAQLDAAGIDRAVCVPGGMINVRQFSRVLSGKLRPDPTIRNHFVYDAIHAHPDRLYGYVCLNPHEGPAALSSMREGFDRGCRGVKLAPLVHRTTFDLPALAEISEECGRRGFPVYTHVVPNPGATTADFAALARRHTQTNFVIGHMGFGPGDADAIEFAAAMPNFYLESSLGNYLILRDALAQAGAEKLVFGSEFPLSHPQVELQKILLLKSPRQDLIVRGNILRLLGVEN